MNHHLDRTDLMFIYIKLENKEKKALDPINLLFKKPILVS